MLLGALFAGGALSTLPASLLLEPHPGNSIYLLTLMGVLTGIACFRLPWHRLPHTALDLTLALGTVEIALVCSLVHETYRVLYFLPVVFAALLLPTRPRVAAQVLLAVAAVFASTASWGHGQEVTRITLLWIPVLLIVSGAVRYLREQLVYREQVEREFAQEAQELAGRLRRDTPPLVRSPLSSSPRVLSRSSAERP